MKLCESKRGVAISLFSGGLDSLLSVCLIREQGIDVKGIVFSSPFFDLRQAKQGAEQLDLRLHVVDFTADILSLIHNPPHGLGSCMNPCIDCHALMLRRAGEMLSELDADFLFTGEVLNERPMSQNRSSLGVVAKDSGCEDLILRPLSACLLPETLPEREGLVDRSKLLALEGLGRKEQFRMAKEYRLVNVPSPAGGCRLTEPNFCKRLKDLKDHEGLNGTRSINLLKYGRHFRISNELKLVVGRNEADNTFIEGTAELYDLVIRMDDVQGPTGLVPFTASEEQLALSASICARYSDSPRDKRVTVRVRSSRAEKKLNVLPATDDVITRILI